MPVAARRPAGLFGDASGLCSSADPSMVFRPATTEQVADIVRACTAEGRALTIQGGLTGLAGGAVPAPGDVVISLAQMNRLEDFDTVGGTATVQAGMVLETLCALVEEQGWYFPLDCGARGSCQIGGNVATNAGGNRVLRYGTMRELVLGLEVVRADGTVLTMLNQGLKNNTGIDLKHLFIGSEGTLGVITRVVLRLFPKPERRYSALLALDTFEQLTKILKRARGSLPELSSFEVMWKDYLQAAAAALDKTPPFNASFPLYILLETEGRNSPEEAAKIQDFLGELLEAELVQDIIVPQNEEQAAQLWKFRDAIGEILRDMQPYVAFDVGISLPALPAFIDSVTAELSQTWPEARSLLFGHLGDGNLHLSTGPHAPENIVAVEELVYRAVQKVQGSISAEHGIGRVKKAFLKYSRSESELALMRELKQVLDPTGCLNAQRVIDTP
ncbi:FAD-binding oxidoreductase [Paenalcaligenes niemegkensis]|uniref:FAD-binding oxidoreductase n=1 Tax=Paenalcaligenes niemegkensis TaxID=2895469 RepID=UPI001EE7F9B7|nr:FAD-binding oxidoreductase [Paenalcaligenes niemegkensis]MCQ9617081.1 FAD-binding oxidoreductase [Paenalcaligenes niemegkensis]